MEPASQAGRLVVEVTLCASREPASSSGTPFGWMWDSSIAKAVALFLSAGTLPMLPFRFASVLLLAHRTACRAPQILLSLLGLYLPSHLKKSPSFFRFHFDLIPRKDQGSLPSSERNSMSPSTSCPVGPNPAPRGIPLAAERSRFGGPRLFSTSSLSFPNVMGLASGSPL